MKISMETDTAILMDLALGVPNKVIADKYGVSQSYVSKVKHGRKVPSCKITETSIITNDNITIQSQDLDKLMIILNTIPVDTKDVAAYVEAQMKDHLLTAKIYQTILNKMKGDLS